MCQSDVYVVEGEGELLLMKDVSWIEETEGGLLLKNLDGQQQQIRARVKYADLVSHHIVVEPVAGAE
jgi:predicted RNA-binding protein